MQIWDPGLRQRAHLCTNFEVTLDPEFARNQKIVLINVDQDVILYLRVNYQHVLKKFPNPTYVLYNMIRICISEYALLTARSWFLSTQALIFSLASMTFLYHIIMAYAYIASSSICIDSQLASTTFTQKIHFRYISRHFCSLFDTAPLHLFQRLFVINPLKTEK